MHQFISRRVQAAAPPSRLVDTRTPDNVFGGPSLAAGETRAISRFRDPWSAYQSLARALSANVMVAPESTLSYLTIWVAALRRPDTAALIIPEGPVKAGTAIVPRSPVAA